MDETAPITPRIKARLNKQLPLDEEEVMGLAALTGPDLFDLFSIANRLRAKLGNTVELCAITNAKSGRCPEDCSFCAQSAHHGPETGGYPLLGPGRLLADAKKAEKAGAHRFSIVTSGNRLKPEELERVLDAVGQIKSRTGLEVCASLGALGPQSARKLKEAGVSRIHHNLESSERFFRHICSTHTYADRIRIIRTAKEAGLEVCSGGIIGLGESMEDRVKLAFALRELDVDAVPINILNPIPGTPMENVAPLPPLEILKSIALFRFILPEKNIRLAGGRERNLRDLQALALFCGADGLMLGNYLTTAGRSPEKDLQMIRDAGLNFENIEAGNREAGNREAGNGEA
ncbi:TPA: biotin synthase BioB, partial [Methanosarcinaceae archaeon]|nr:biotin synthase BioB [Methanosarcinaceae archaeon]